MPKQSDPSSKTQTRPTTSSAKGAEHEHKTAPPMPRCSFCGLSVNKRPALAGKNNAIICLQCASKSKELLERELAAEQQRDQLNVLREHLASPRVLHEFLSQHVIGQAQAQRVLAVAVYLHYKRILNQLEGNKTLAKEYAAFAEIELDKANVLLIGPSGAGKTLLAATLARWIGVPFAIADATTLTQAGYVGDDVENILLRLLQNAQHDVSWAEKGIIFIDEIDKLGRKSESSSITRDVSGEGVQQALLKLIEGTTARVPLQGGRKHPQGQAVTINTEQILFIAGGAFVGLEELVRRRTQLSAIGFNAGGTQQQQQTSQDGWEQDIIPDDLVKYGLIPELVGRLPVITGLSELNAAELRQILTEPKHALMKQYAKLLAMEGLTMDVKKDFYDYVVTEAVALKTGARALKTILERIMSPIFYEAPERKAKRVVLSGKTLASGQFFY